MGDWDWQLVVAAIIVVGAAVFLGRRVMRLVKNNSQHGCGSGGCGSCSTKATSDTGGRNLPLVSLEPEQHTND